MSTKPLFMLPNHTHLAPRRNERGGRLYLPVLLLSAFGPYVHSSGLRLEHLVIYPALMGLAIGRLHARSSGIPFTLFVPVLLLILATSWSFAVSIGTGSIADFASFLPAVENFVQPIAIILLVAWVTYKQDSQSLDVALRRSCRIILALLSLNALLSIAEIFLDTWPVVQYFVRGTGDAGTVWQRALGNHRYSGIFNQPLEAGIAYSLGLIVWVHLVSKPVLRSTPPMAIALVLLIAGGVLSVSKVFILGGLPLFVIYLGATRGLRLLQRPVAAVGGLALATSMALAIAPLIEKWAGIRHLLRLFDAAGFRDSGMLYLYTAGRFGSTESAVISLFREVWQRAPVHGFGFGSVTGALDNAYLEFFYQGGIVALGFYVALLVAGVMQGVRRFRGAPDESRLMLVILVLVVGAGLGAPVLTINRASVFLWTVLSLAVLLQEARRRERSFRALRDGLARVTR